MKKEILKIEKIVYDSDNNKTSTCFELTSKEAVKKVYEIAENFWIKSAVDFIEGSKND